jgi:hypothetical protein
MLLMTILNINLVGILQISYVGRVPKSAPWNVFIMCVEHDIDVDELAFNSS